MEVELSNSCLLRLYIILYEIKSYCYYNFMSFQIMGYYEIFSIDLFSRLNNIDIDTCLDVTIAY